jgi:hypothetical protein
MKDMINTLFVHIFKVWKEQFPELPSLEKNDFLVLTSSSNKKGKR